MRHEQNRSSRHYNRDGWKIDEKLDCTESVQSLEDKGENKNESETVRNPILNRSLGHNASPIHLL